LGPRAEDASFIFARTRVRGGEQGNPHGNRHHSRHLLNQEFIQALLLHFRQHGKKVIEKVAREQPAAYIKILALLVPREMKIEHTDPVKGLSDEQLAAMIRELKERIARRVAVADSDAKLIEGTVEPAVEATTLPVLKSPRRRPNRLMMEADTAIGPRERRPRKSKVPSSGRSRGSIGRRVACAAQVGAVQQSP
jgi:hypothetical protein